MRIKLTALSDVGKLRTNNEDAFAICPNLSISNWEQEKMEVYLPIESDGSLLIVADGMGGPDAGEVASHVAIELIKSSFTAHIISSYTNEDEREDFLKKVIADANTAICNSVIDKPEAMGMGTTIVLCWIFNDVAHIAWCGDSRCYVYNPKNGLKPLTKDHSYVQELVDRGEITVKQAFTHPENHVITKGLGDLDVSAEPDIITYPVVPNDLFILCSDGLCGLCRDKSMERVLDQYYKDVDQCKKELLNLALDAGGDDNICIALASVIEDNKECPDDMSFMDKVKAFFRSVV